MTETHELQLTASHDDWYAVCSCGRWEADAGTDEEAEEQWEFHCDAVFAEASEAAAEAWMR